MDRHRLDQFARLLAASRSRRQVIRVATTGFVSTIVLARSAQPAAAELCEERVPKPGYTPEVNGCGPSGFGWTVPDNYGDANWTPACDRHDRCYGTCNESRLKCDILMRKSMQHACKRAYRRDDERKELRKCLNRARFYFHIVSEHGQSAYEDAQIEACECCNTEENGPKCDNRCCEPEEACTDPGFWRCCPVEKVCNETCCLTQGWDVCCPSNSHVDFSYCCPTGSSCVDNVTGCGK